MKVSKQYVLGLRKLAEQGTALASDQEALEFLDIVPKWEKGTNYQVDARVTAEENGVLTLYKCLKAHKSKNKQEPSTDTSTWSRISK